MYRAPPGEGNALKATGGEAGSQGTRECGPGRRARPGPRSWGAARGRLRDVYTYGYIFLAMCPAGAAPSLIAQSHNRSLLKGSAVQMPSADVTVTEHMLGLAPGRYGRAALVDPACGLTISYSSLAAKVRAAAAGLTRRGMRPGDAAGIHVTGAAAFALASQSIRAAGGVPSPAAAGAATGDIAAQLTQCDARILITDSSLAGAAMEIAERSRVRQVISFGQASGATRFDALLGAGTLRPLARAACPLALLAWTADSGGRPRPLPVTHGELAGRLRELASAAKLAAWDIIVAGPPSGDGRGYSALLDLALTVGATIVSAPSHCGADLLSVAHSHRATVAFVPPGREFGGNSVRPVTVTP
jgi:non-ribosomal peptide synthetase component E (peptide arylation enzyme)